MKLKKRKQPKQQPKAPIKLNLGDRKPTLAEVVANQGGGKPALAEQRSWKPGDRKPTFAEATNMFDENTQARLREMAREQEQDRADMLVWKDARQPIPARLEAHMRMTARRRSGLVKD